MDPANIEASYAFIDAKRKLRMVLSTADLQHVPWATDATTRMVRDCFHCNVLYKTMLQVDKQLVMCVD
jgi:hypothetical protein